MLMSQSLQFDTTEQLLMLACKVAIALDLAVSAGTTVKTDATANFMDLGAFREEVGFFIFHEDFNVLFRGFLTCQVACIWDIKLRYREKNKINIIFHEADKKQHSWVIVIIGATEYLSNDFINMFS